MYRWLLIPYAAEDWMKTWLEKEKLLKLRYFTLNFLQCLHIWIKIIPTKVLIMSNFSSSFLEWSAAEAPESICMWLRFKWCQKLSFNQTYIIQTYFILYFITATSDAQRLTVRPSWSYTVFSCWLSITFALRATWCRNLSQCSYSHHVGVQGRTYSKKSII